jgi:predicted DNA-binding protein
MPNGPHGREIHAMVTALIHLNPDQKERLARRAKLRGKSFSQEVRDAINLYLDIPVESEEELSALAKEANRATGRMIRRLDETIAHVDSVLPRLRKNR